MILLCIGSIFFWLTPGACCWVIPAGTTLNATSLSYSTPYPFLCLLPNHFCLCPLVLASSVITHDMQHLSGISQAILMQNELLLSSNFFLVLFSYPTCYIFFLCPASTYVALTVGHVLGTTTLTLLGHDLGYPWTRIAHFSMVPQFYNELFNSVHFSTNF